MFGFGENRDNYDQVYNSDGPPHEAKFSHEAIAGAASFAAFKMFEDHQRREGKQVSHQFAKEALVGLAGAEIDKLIETKGMDFLDREKAKHQAKRNAEHMYDSHHGRHDEYDPSREAPREIQEYREEYRQW